MRSKILAGIFLVLLAVSPSQAEEPQMMLDTIVVTPYRYAQTLNKTASSVSVITPQEIKNSNAQNTVDLLRTVPGVVVRDYYGNRVTAAVDIAGFGEQAALNVLVLVDGRRVNDVDLSGVDWSQIPLDQVERIEVTRAGSSGVLYGDNASSGVINIITKKGAGKPKVKVENQLGSYDLNKQNLSLQGSSDKKLSYFFSLGRQATHGWRENSFNKAKDFASKLEYSPSDAFSLHFNSGFHASSYGMPSGLFQHHINEQGRRWARYGEDHTNYKDYYFLSGAEAGDPKASCLAIDFNYRVKNTNSYFLTSHNDTRKNNIQAYGATPKYTLANSVFGRENKLAAGIDYYRTIYHSNNYLFSNETSGKGYTNIYKNSLGSYLHDEFSLLEQLLLSGGLRYEAARYLFGYHDYTGNNPDRDSKLHPVMNAFDCGLVYTYKEDSSLFFNAGKSFRFPEVDEFTGNFDINFQQFLNTNLRPQGAKNYQIGLRHKFSDQFKGSFSLFRMKVKDYIYYNPTGGQWGFGENENYEKTLHDGLESSLEAKLSSRVNLFGNYSFTRASFYGGQYDKNEIPLVPRHKASAGLRFILPKNITLNLIDTCVGKRYFINDQANAVSRLNGYMVFDANLSLRHNDFTVTLGINNLFDKHYSEYGVYGTDSSNGFVFDKCYFPSPERNFNLKIDYAF